MISINLLPEHLRPVKRTPLPYLFGIALFVLAVLGMAFVFLQNQAEISAAERELAQNKSDLDDLRTIVEKSNELASEKDRLAVKLQTIQEIVADRIIWSRQLHSLNRLAPPNLWFQEIAVENKPFKERIPYSDPRTGQTKERVVRVDRPVLRLEGYVISVDGETPTISPLTLATEEDDEFRTRFELLTTAFADTTFETFPVRSFTLEYSIEFPKSVIDEASQAAVEEAVAAEEDTSQPGTPADVSDEPMTESETTPEPESDQPLETEAADEAAAADESTQESAEPAPMPEENAP